MKKSLSIFLSFLLLVSCALTPEEKQERIVFNAVAKSFPDFDKVVHYSKEYVTFGDNLRYRISQAEHNISFIDSQIQQFSKDVQYDKKHNFLISLETDQKHLEEEINKKDKAIRWLNALDSLKAASNNILNQVTAVTYCIQYNYVGNFVWVQVGGNNNILLVTNDSNKVLLNPGDDVPGYLELYFKYN